MKSRKVQELIHVLSAIEKQEFVNWLTVELNGKQQGTLEMAIGLTRGDSVKELWQFTYPSRPFPEKPYQDSGFRRREYQVSHQLERFLALKRIRSDKSLLQLKLLEELKSRGAERIFVNTFNKTKRELQGEKKLDGSYYEYLYRLEREWREYLLRIGNKKQLEKNRSSLNFLMDTWWFHEKMRAVLMNLSQDSAATMDPFMPPLLQYIRKHEVYGKVPLLIIYGEIYQMLTSNDLILAPRIQGWLKEHIDEIQEDIVQDIFNILHNYYVRNFNQTGEKGFTQSLWELYQWGIESGILLHEGVLSPGRYRNLLETGIRVGELEQVWTYLSTLTSKLPVDSQEEEYRFNLGGYYAAKGDLKMASRTLGGRFSHPHKEINARMKLLRLRYEEGEREDLEHELRALRAFCRRNENMNPVFRQNVVNEIKVFQSLIKAFHSTDFRKLSDQIDKTSPLVSRAWFRSQAGIDPESI